LLLKEQRKYYIISESTLASANPKCIGSGLVKATSNTHKLYIELTEKNKAQRNNIANSQNSKSKYLEKNCSLAVAFVYYHFFNSMRLLTSKLAYFKAGS